MKLRKALRVGVKLLMDPLYDRMRQLCQAASLIQGRYSLKCQ